jgi:hypothetical protein
MFYHFIIIFAFLSRVSPFPSAEHIALDKIVKNVLAMYHSESLSNFRPALLAMSHDHAVDGRMLRNTIHVCETEIRDNIGTLNKRK